MNEDSLFILPEISDEQQLIVDAIKIDNNVIVNAVAGSGKTTTVCHIAKTLPKKRILLLTYNKRLKSETSKTLMNYGITNVYTSNYHSFCYNKYVCGDNTDQIILNALSSYKENEEIRFNYDIIIIDEAQDLNELYTNFIKMIINHNNKLPVMCILGDVRQTIYTFNGADCRFLLFADKIFNCKTNNWCKLSLNVSYRLSNSVTKFINECVFKDDIIISNGNTGYRPRYMFCDAFGDVPINELIGHYLVKFNYTYNDIFILAPSIQSDSSPVKMLANTLSSHYDIPIFIPTSDSEKLDSQTTNNKIIFATFHQVKGLQRKCVLMFGFDNSYYYYYNTDVPQDICPNEIYVGLTRCTERLTVFHHYKKNFINFIDTTKIPVCCYTGKIKTVKLNVEYLRGKKVDINLRMFDTINIRNYEETVINFILEHNAQNEPLDKPVKMSVSKLLTHLPVQVINKALSYVNVQCVKNINKEKEKVIKNPFDSDDEELSTPGLKLGSSTENIKNDNFIVNVFLNEIISENVSEIIGTAIPIYYEYVKFNNIPIIDWITNELIKKNVKNTSNSVYSVIWTKFQRIKLLKKIKSIDLFELVTIYLGLQNNVIHKVNQIHNFKLMSMENIKKCLKRIDNHITIGRFNPRFEAYMESFISMDISGYDVPIKRVLNGYIDCIDKTTLWEFKMVQNIQTIHLLQLAVYAYLFYSNLELGKSFKLLNINDGSKYIISGSIESFTKLVYYLFKHKFTKPIILSDEEFLLRYCII